MACRNISKVPLSQRPLCEDQAQLLQFVREHEIEIKSFHNTVVPTLDESKNFKQFVSYEQLKIHKKQQTQLQFNVRQYTFSVDAGMIFNSIKKKQVFDLGLDVQANLLQRNREREYADIQGIQNIAFCEIKVQLSAENTIFTVSPPVLLCV